RESRAAALDRPDHAAQRPPLPEQQDERGAGEEHIGRALQRLRYEARPRVLEPGARHDAVLQGEERQQTEVDRQRDRERSDRRAVERLRNGETSDESDGEEERRKEDRVTNDAVGEKRDALEHEGPPNQGWVVRRCRSMG